MNDSPPPTPLRQAAAGIPESAPQARAAAAALAALSRAARSVVLYDVSNATVRHHLREYQARTCGALDQYGEISIAVAPFHLAVVGHIVLEDRDREKSLPFRLYRDGIRTLRILSHASWDELLELLQIIAVRCTSVRQQEEDTVTLLRRAEFDGIQIETVEGFTPLEEFPEPELEARLERERGAAPPAGWDTPLEKLPSPGPLGYRDPTAEELAPFRDETDDEALAQLSLSLACDLLTEATRSGWPMPNRDMVAYFAEVRDALLVDGRLDLLQQLVDILARAGSSELRDQMLHVLGDGRTLEAVLAAVPLDADKLPQELVSFLPLLGTGAALDQLAATASEGRRSLLTKMILARVPRETDLVLARLPSLEPPVARRLAEGIVLRAPERSAEVARQLLSQKDDALRLEGLTVIERAPGRVPLRPIHHLLDDRSEAVRVRAAEVLAACGDATAVDPLLAVLDSGRPVPPAMAEAAGRAIGRLAPERAGALFTGWLEQKGRFLRGLGAAQRAKQWAAVAGTGVLPDARAEVTLRGLAEGSEGDLRRHCLATLARRRKEQGRG